MSRGQVLAEFAIASLALFAIMFGIIDFGRAMYTYHLVSNGARIGARYAIVHGATSCPGGTPSPDPLQAYVASQSPGVDQSVLKVTSTCSDTPECLSSGAPYNRPGCSVAVKVDYTFTFLTPLVSKLVPKMTSTSTMAISG